MRAGERLVVVLDSEYVCKGVTEWSIKWRRHGWRSRGREIGHMAGDLGSETGGWLPGCHAADAVALKSDR